MIDNFVNYCVIIVILKIENKENYGFVNLE